MSSPDPIAEALRPAFVRAAWEVRRTISSGGSGSFSVLSGHLPKAFIQVLAEGPSRTFSMFIPAADQPASGLCNVDHQDGIDASDRYIAVFEADGPGILSSTIRQCILDLMSAGIGHEVLMDVIRRSVASDVMET